VYLLHVSEYVATNVHIFRLQIIRLPATKRMTKENKQWLSTCSLWRFV